MLDLLLIALALMLVIEGIYPFLNPAAYRRFLMQVAQLTDKNLRNIGLSMMVLGAIGVYLLSNGTKP